MNCTQARKISLFTYIQSLGYQPIRQRGNIFRFNSPLRDDKNPSFDIDIVKNTFIDWGTGQKGDIITFVQLLRNTDVRGALEILSAYAVKPLSEMPISSFKKQNGIKRFNPAKRIGELSKIRDKRLIEYLEKRQIGAMAWKNCTELRECNYHYSNNPTFKYCNLAFMNHGGGYELSYQDPITGKKFKGCEGPKDITFLDSAGYVLHVFEGFFDYLSALTYYNCPYFSGVTVILNTTAIIHKILDHTRVYKKVISYLDNDQAGQEAFIKLSNVHKNVENQSKILFPNYKDFNEFLMHVKK